MIGDRAGLLRLTLSLRQFARYLADHEPDIDTIAAIDRDVAEDYTVWLAARLGHAARCR